MSPICVRTRRCRVGNVRRRPRPLREIQPRERPAASHRTAVPEFDWVIDGLRQWVEQARPLLSPVPREQLWLTERRERVSTKTMDKRFAFLRGQAGLPKDLTLHCLRHSYVTHLIEFGYPERFGTEQVGHSYASTTAIYTNPGNCIRWGDELQVA